MGFIHRASIHTVLTNGPDEVLPRRAAPCEEIRVAITLTAAQRVHHRQHRDHRTVGDGLNYAHVRPPSRVSRRRVGEREEGLTKKEFTL